MTSAFIAAAQSLGGLDAVVTCAGVTDGTAGAVFVWHPADLDNAPTAQRPGGGPPCHRCRSTVRDLGEVLPVVVTLSKR